MQRKVSVGDTLSEVFAIYGAQAGALLPAAFWLFLAVSILDGLVGTSLTLLPILLVVSGIVGTLYQGMVVGLVRGLKQGSGESSFGTLVGSATPVLLPLIVAGLIYGLGTGIGMLLLLAPGLYLMAIWAVIAPVIVIERRTAVDSLGRSRELVRGNGWPVLWVVLVAFLITLAGSLVFAQVARGISDGPLVLIVFNALAATITAPINALAAAVLYYRLLELSNLRQPPDVSSESASGSGSTTTSDVK